MGSKFKGLKSDCQQINLTQAFKGYILGFVTNGTQYRRWLKAQAKRRKRIKALHDAGKSLTQIARQFRITPARAHQIVND